MSKALECALSLTEEFHKAQYLDDVDPKTVKALAVLLFNVLDEAEGDQVLKNLSKIDPSIDVSGIAPEDFENHPHLTKDQTARFLFWSLAFLSVLIEMAEKDGLGLGHGLTPAEEAEAEEKTKEWAEEMRKELEEADPAFARYVFGPPKGPAQP